jgi:uncharacterized membrane protein
MKNFAGNLVKLLVIATAVSATVLLFKLGQKWWIPLLFSYNFSIVAGYVFMGPIASGILLTLALIVNGLAHRRVHTRENVERIQQLPALYRAGRVEDA